jgi:transmembrane sensor
MSAQRQKHSFDDRGPLGGPLADRLKPGIDEERVAAVWQQIRHAQSERRRAKRSPWRLMIALPAMAAAAMLVVWLGWWRGGVETAREPIGMLLARNPEVKTNPGVELSVDAAAVSEELLMRDGSKMRLDPGAKLQVLENDGERFVALLERGPARFEVPAGQRRWTIETKAASIEVIASVFTVAHEHHQVRIEVERGVLMVRGQRVPGREIRLATGDVLLLEDGTKPGTSAAVTAPAVKIGEPNGVGAELPAVEIRAQPSSSSPAIALGKPARATSIATRPAAPAAPSLAPSQPAPAPAPAIETSRAPAGAGDDVLLRRKPGAGEETASAPVGSIAEALRGADSLRQGGDPAAAAQLLERALSAYPSEPAAGMVEFTLGRLYLDRLDEPGRAAAAFAAVLARGAPQSLIEDATARHCEALWKAGRKAIARNALQQYVARYPKGARRAALEALMVSP